MVATENIKNTSNDIKLSCAISIASGTLSRLSKLSGQNLSSHLRL
jgi:hypothetical protein